MTAQNFETAEAHLTQSAVTGVSGGNTLMGDRQDNLKILSERVGFYDGGALPGVVILDGNQVTKPGEQSQSQSLSPGIIARIDKLLGIEPSRDKAEVPLVGVGSLDSPADRVDPWSKYVVDDPGNPLGNAKIETLHEKLWDRQYNNLSRADRAEYDKENQAAQSYKDALLGWELHGSQGNPPAKPDTPMHDKVDAAVAADQKRIEAQVRAQMGPVNSAILDAAITAYERACQVDPSTPMPPEIQAYQKSIEKAVNGDDDESKGFHLFHKANPWMFE